MKSNLNPYTVCVPFYTIPNSNMISMRREEGVIEHTNKVSESIANLNQVW